MTIQELQIMTKSIEMMWTWSCRWWSKWSLSGSWWSQWSRSKRIIGAVPKLSHFWSYWVNGMLLFICGLNCYMWPQLLNVASIDRKDKPTFGILNYSAVLNSSWRNWARQPERIHSRQLWALPPDHVYPSLPPPLWSVAYHNDDAPSLMDVVWIPNWGPMWHRHSRSWALKLEICRRRLMSGASALCVC